MTINIDPNATLTINTEKVGSDKDVAGALYLNSDAILNVNGKLAINSKGTPSASKSNGVPVYINGNANISVGNGGSFVLDATNLGDYSSSLISVNGKGSVNLAPHSTFKISGDGTGALTAINLSAGSTFTSDQPEEFTIDLSGNNNSGKRLIKNGAINFTRVKSTNVDSQYQVPLGKVYITYKSTGDVENATITSEKKQAPRYLYDYLINNPSKLTFVAAGEDVTLSDLHLSKDNKLTGIATSSGDSKSPIYIIIKINGKTDGVPEAGNYRVYTYMNGSSNTNKVNYSGSPTAEDGTFTIDLSSLADKLTNDAEISVVTTKDFVDSPTLTETVAELRKVDTNTLQELVADAPTEEAKPSYYNASADAQKTYTDAISAGQTILVNIKNSTENYDQSDIDTAVNNIKKAQQALTGKDTNKDTLKEAVNAADTTKTSENYTNADANLQKAYTDAISAGQTILSNENATQTEVDNALDAITAAKTALNGDTKKAASKESLQQAVNAAPTVRTDAAAYYNGTEKAKKTYNDAISAGQKVLDNPDATATQITDALNTINTAKNNLDGKATDKVALQTAVNNSATVKESNNYTNADETQKTAYDDAITAAKTVLDKTNATQTEVNQALQDLETANNNLNGDSKTEAANKAALEAAVKEAPTVRETPAYYNGSSEAQTAYNNAISAGQAILDKENPTASEVKNALDAITTAKGNLKGEATNTEALETALTNANNAKATGNYTNADQAKQEALTNAINAGQEVSTNAKATQAEVDTATKAITDAINDLNGDTNLENAKTAATEDIQKALDAKTTEITNSTNIDQTTKDQLIADAKNAAEDANKAIKQATDADSVNTAKTEGTANINNVTVPSLDDAKNAAIKVVDEALTDQTKLITDATNLSDSEKQNLIKQATDAANEAKDKISSATTNDTATQAGQDGKTTIEKVVPTSLDDAKNAANQVVEDALNKKLAEIQKATNLTDEEKAKLESDANSAATTAKENIAKATTNDAAAQAGQDGATAIDNIKVPADSAVKQAAKDAIDAATKTKDAAIDASNLTNEEKAALKQKVTEAQNAADQAIDNATTNTAVTEAQTNGVNDINGIKVPTNSDTKDQAKKDITAAADDAKKAIDQDSYLTDDQKKAAKDQIDSDAKKAQDAIDNAKSDDDIKKAVDDGTLAIDKDVANAAIDNAAAGKKAEISNSSLTDEEKQKLVDEVNNAAADAKNNIANAKTAEDVNKAKDDGVDKINGVKVPDNTDNHTDNGNNSNNSDSSNNSNSDTSSNKNNASKDDAKNESDTDADDKSKNLPNHKSDNSAAIDEIKKKANDKKAEIDKSKASTSDKEKLKKLVDQEAKNAIAQIRNASSTSKAEEAKNRGIAAIENITPKGENLSRSKKTGHGVKANNSLNARAKGQNRTPDSNVRALAEAKNKANNANKSNKVNKDTLPATGSRQNEGLVALGLLAAGAAGLIALLGSRKKKD